MSDQTSELLVKRRCLKTLLMMSLVIAPASAKANAWLLEPSIGLDQRFDDNYQLDDTAASSLSATRVFAGLIGSLEKRDSALRGKARVGQQLIIGDDQSDGSEADGFFELDSLFRTQRLRYGLTLGYSRTTTSLDDIIADLTDDEDVATDPGRSRGRDVLRGEYTAVPNIEYDLSRRTILEASLEYKRVNHGLPDPQDLIYAQYLNVREREIQEAIANGGSADDVGPEIPFNEVTTEDSGQFQVARDDLVDFQQFEFELGTRFRLTETTTLTGKVSHLAYTGRVDADPALFFVREELEFDPDEPDIQRKPARNSRSNTSTFRLGYERVLSPVLSFGVEGGVYYTQINKRDTRRGDDFIFDNELEEPVRVDEIGPLDRLELLTGDDEGWLANLTFTRDDGVLRYVGKYSVDVRASSTGSQVEATTLTGDVFWTVNPRTNVSLRTRAYEPKTVGEEGGVDEFSRRFISLEPRISWDYSRAWTLAAAYRYRRQKAESDDVASGSNAVLFSIRYTPPTALRAVANSDGF